MKWETFSFSKKIESDIIATQKYNKISNFRFFSLSTVPKTIKSTSDYISDLYKINVVSRPAKKDVSTSTLDKSSIMRWVWAVFTL